MFLLVRGKYAWIGTSWLGCVSGSDPPSPGPGAKGKYTFPDILHTDVGTPVDSVCKETAPGVFERKWSKGSVRMDCNTWEGKLRAR